MFLLKIKIKENAGRPSKEYNAIFDHIPVLINNYENIIVYSVESELSEV